VNTPTVGPIRYRPPVNVDRPTVTGALQQGSTLVASPGKWASGGASTAPIQLSYSWYRGCTVGPKPDCSNAGEVGSASSLVLSAADVGRSLSLVVTGSYPDGAGGQATNAVSLSVGRVVSSSIKAGDTLGGTVQWTAAAPGARTISLSVNEAEIAVLAADESGTASFALDTTTLRNGSNDLSLTITWNETTAPTTVEIGAVTVSNAPATPPPRVTPVIAAPTVERRPRAGKLFVVTFAVRRSDDGRPLRGGALTCTPSIGGRAVAHTESLANGRARIAVRVPATGTHALLRVKVTIRLGNQTTSRLATFRVG
jgi:hypothetical protein